MKYGHLIDSQADIQRQWPDLAAYFSPKIRNQLIKKSCKELRVYLSKFQQFSDEYLFKNIACLVKLILTLPHSNSEAERIFSLTLDAKTKKKHCGTKA